MCDLGWFCSLCLGEILWVSVLLVILLMLEDSTLRSGVVCKWWAWEADLGFV